MFFWPLNDLKKIFWSNTIYIKIYYIFIALLLLVYFIIFTKPVFNKVEEKVNKNGIDIQIVLDVSTSMNTADLKPSRLVVAKEVIDWFLNKITSDRVWVIIFAWKTFTSLPLSFDYNIAKKIVSDISINTISQSSSRMQWTAAGDALLLAVESLKNDEKREKVIIFLTDWEANRGIDPLIALKYIKASNNPIKVYTIWIWWIENSFVTVVDSFWRKTNLPVDWIDEEVLTLIANETWWKYFRAKNKEAFKEIFDEISSLEKTKLTTETINFNIDKSIYFVYLLVLLFLSFLILKTKKRIF